MWGRKKTRLMPHYNKKWLVLNKKSDKTYKETGMYGSFKETNKIDGKCFWVSPDIGLIRQRLED